MIFGIESGRFAATIAALLMFGVLYALLTYWMRREGYLRGVTSYMVMWGVLVTLTGNIMIHSPNPTYDYILELVSFAATGLPMIIEHQVTHFNEQKAARIEENNRIETAIQGEQS